MFEERKINEKLRQQYREKGYWTDQTLLDCWEATVEKFPNREYVVDDRGFRYTYKQMDEAAGRHSLWRRGSVPGIPYLISCRSGVSLSC